MTKLLDWVGGCRCHGLETTPAERASCNWKGRRLPEAHAHATSTLRGAMEEVNSWTPEMLGGYELLRQGQACMRGTFLLSLEKLQFLDELPCLLVRLDQPGVRDRCLQQWDVEGARAACDPVAHEFCGNGPDTFRADLKAMNADGTGMSERLFRAWDSLRASPMDDTLGEGPHAQMKHVQIRTRAATWGWQAATVRLKQNLLDVEHVLPKVTPPTNLQWCWNRWTSVLQVHRGEHRRGTGA
jgi:hypothetical protein